MESVSKLASGTRTLSDADLRESPEAALAFLEQLIARAPDAGLANCLRRLLVSWHPATELSEKARMGFGATLGKLSGHPDPRVRGLAGMLGERVLGRQASLAVQALRKS